MAAPPDPLAALGSLPHFSPRDGVPFDPEALGDLASRTETWAFSEGDLVQFPDEAPGGPTWVIEGCLAVLENKEPRFIGVRERLEAPAGVWVRGQSDGRFLTVPEGSWRAWLAAWPDAAARLGEQVPPVLPKGLYHSPLVLEPGETPVHLFRKSSLFLVRRILVPGVFFLMFLGFGLGLQFGLGVHVPALALWLVPGLGLAVTAGLSGLVVWEWRTSVLAVTDRSVILRQIDVWFHRSDFEKLALENLREAVFSKQGLLDTVFRLVNLELEGDSPRGRLVFRGLSRDSRFLKAMGDLKVKRTAGSPTRKVIRQALADRAGGARAPKLERPADRAGAPGPTVRKLSWRTEKNGEVRFRRHPWHLVLRCLPWVGWAALAGFLALVAVLYWPRGAGTAVALGFLGALYPLGRIGWMAHDWANDWLAVAGEKIILVKKRPLWFGEVRQEGTLDEVQQVGVRKDSLTALVFDFGTVSVSLGASDPLVFDHASHPEWVQNEIFHRRTLLALDRERAGARARLDEVTEILDTWDEARKAGYFAEKEKELR